MKSFLDRLDAESMRILRSIGAQVQKAGSRAYVVGGCVRDLILKRKVLDLDVVIEGDAIAAARQFSSGCKGRLVAYPQFGTATVVLPNGRAVDFASARQEKYPYPGALPVVAKGNIQEDLFRRDFTVNAMAIMINEKCFGQLVDHYGGLDDIKGKRIRVLHDQSFVDDPTRILRAVRFEQRFRFFIEPATLRLLKQSLKKKAPATVKAQRYFEEFKNNLKESNVSENLRRLSGLRALDFLKLAFTLDQRHVRLLQEAPKVLSWADKNLTDWSSSDGWVVYLMVILDGMPPVTVGEILERFAIANVDRKKIIGSLSSGNILAKLALSPREAFEAMRLLSVEELFLLRVKALSVSVRAKIQKHLVQWRCLKLKINGDDLQQLGIPSGRKYKIILDEVLCALVEGRCSTRSEQLAYARGLAKTTRSS